MVSRWSGTKRQARAQTITRGFIALLACLSFAATAQKPGQDGGLDFGRPSTFRHLIPADGLEKQAAQQYQALLRQAAEKGALAPADSAQLLRLRAIANRMIPLVGRYLPRAAQWKWEINLIGANTINAFCMPGGKIVFYTGIVNGLKLTDDEIAMVMGHEIAHALREHARERIAKSELTRLGASVLAQSVASGKYATAFEAGGSLLSLKFSRDDETEADLVGLDLAARAGFDPRAGVTLWQKMTAASKGAPPSWLSTHPSGPARIREIETYLPKVLPIYERAAGRKTSQ